MASSGLQAVVLCGGLGNRMTDLTDYIPKCMLPIAGVPMFWYPLNFLLKNSIKEVILVVAEHLLGEVKQLLSGSSLPPLGDLRLEFVSLGTVAENWGTADVLRHISDRIKKDFIVVSGDFVSDMNLSPMLALHRAENAALTCLLTDRVITGPVPGVKVKRSKGRDFVALSKNNQLLFIGSEEDYEETVPVNIALLNKTFASLKADFIPYILGKQFAKDGHEYIEHAAVDPLDEMVRKFSFGTANVKKRESSLRCFAYLLPQENGCIVAHVNTTGAYFEVNKAIVRFLNPRFSDKFPAGQRIENVSTASGSECYVSSAAELAVLGPGEAPLLRSEKPVIKRSVIGAKSVIGQKTKIINSLLMDGCVVGAGAQITNSIICTGAEVGENAEISSSIVINRQNVPANAKIQNELIAPNDEVELEEWTEER